MPNSNNTIIKNDSIVIVKYGSEPNPKIPWLKQTICSIIDKEAMHKYNQIITHGNFDSINLISQDEIEKKKLSFVVSDSLLKVKILYYGQDRFLKGIIDYNNGGIIYLKFGDTVSHNKSLNNVTMYLMEYQIELPKNFILKELYFRW